MKVAYFEPGKPSYTATTKPQTFDDYEWISVLNFKPDVNILKQHGFREWVRFDKTTISNYLDKGGEWADTSKSKGDNSSKIRSAMTDRKNFLGRFNAEGIKAKEGKAIGIIDTNKNFQRIYLQIKYEAFVQGYLCYFEYNTSAYTSKHQTDCRTIYFDWGILDPDFGLTIFLNPVMNPGGYKLNPLNNYSSQNQNAVPAGATSETDPQQPPQPPPPPRNDSV